MFDLQMVLAELLAAAIMSKLSIIVVKSMYAAPEESMWFLLH